jgi:hypothetical protein
MPTCGVSLPRWLASALLAYDRRFRQRKLFRRDPLVHLDQLEPRLLLATYSVTGIGGHGHVQLWWDTDYHLVAYATPAVGGGGETLIPGADTAIQIDGSPGNETAVLDFSYGAPRNGASFSFVNGGANNTLVILDNSNDGSSITVEPGEIIFHDVVDSVNTTINYNSTSVSQLTFALTGAHSVTVEGADGNVEKLPWNSLSFPSSYTDALGNSEEGYDQSLSLVVGSGGNVSFAQSTTLNSLEIQSGGSASVNDSPDATPYILTTTNGFTLDGSNGTPAGALDLANNELDVDYSGTDPVGAIRSDLIRGMGTRATPYDVGDWNGTTGILSSAAQNDFPAALGYVDDSTDTQKMVQVRYTLYGDTNLDGQVTGNVTNKTGDAAQWGANGTVDWQTGDLNYDGMVNSEDAELFALGEEVSGANQTSLNAVATYQSRVDLSWSPVLDSNGQPLSNVDGYKIEYKLVYSTTFNGTYHAWRAFL